MAAGPWKFDMTLLDLTGYSSNSAVIYLADDDRLIVSISSESEAGLYDDFFVEDHRTTQVQSEDGGISWVESEDQLPPAGVRAPDGTRVYIGGQTLGGDSLREHLEREGLGHLHKPDGMMAYRLYKAEKRAGLEAQGWQVDDAFGGIVAVYPEIVTWRSEDDGKTWNSSPIDNAPRGDFPMAAHMVGFFGSGLLLPDGAILGAVYGRLNRTERTTRVWSTRSVDSGRTWTFTPVFFDPEDRIGYKNQPAGHALRPDPGYCTTPVCSGPEPMAEHLRGWRSHLERSGTGAFLGISRKADQPHERRHHGHLRPSPPPHRCAGMHQSRRRPELGRRKREDHQG